MNKQEFFDALRQKLSGLPDRELDERLAFWGEMIDDRIEEGLAEEAAVAAVGNVEEIATQILSEVPLIRLVKEKVRQKRKRTTLEIVLLCLGAPVWGSLLIALLAVIFSVYVSVWAVVASLWASFGATAICAPAGLVESVLLIVLGKVPTALALVAASLVLAGLAILLYYGCLATTKGTWRLGKKILLGIKRCFVGKEKRDV